MSTPKEIHFFDRYYHRGLEWYETCFPTADIARRYRAIGEFTPSYMFERDYVKRIARVPDIGRFIIILRHPLERLISHYHHRARLDNYRHDILRFCKDYPYVINRSCYFDALTTCLACLGRDRVLVLIYEEMTQDILTTRRQLAEHLNLNVTGFSEVLPARRINYRHSVGWPRIEAALTRLNRWIRDSDADWLIYVLKRAGAEPLKRRLIGVQPPVLSVSEIQKQQLGDLLAPELDLTEAVLGRSLRSWRGATSDHANPGGNTVLQQLPESQTVAGLELQTGR